MELVWAGVCFVVFLALYAVLRQRASRRPIEWRWLAAIGVCAAAAILIGAFDR